VAERVVFDTNIWISGLMWRGKPYQCLLLARTGVVQALYCQEMVAELTHKLRQVFGFSEDHIRAVVHDLRRTGEKAEITGDLRVVARDPDDDKFVECAVIGGAAMLVSGDHHLLDLDEYQGIHIVSAAEFIAHFTESEDIIEEE
jgi:putative PIN family toxin of toxin-antitoxin system